MVYSLYGLNLASDLPLRGAARTSTERADVTFTMEPIDGSSTYARGEDERCWYQSDWTDEAGTPGLTIYRSAAAGTFRICYHDGVEFLVDGSGQRIVGRAPSEASLRDVTCYVTGPVLGFILRLYGIVALHASAVEIGRAAVLLVGDARSGKSTTAAMLATMGYRVITEDVAALFIDGDCVSVHAGCAEIALRPDAVATIYGSVDALPRFTDTWDKRRLDLAAIDAFSPASVPVGGVYLLANTAGIPGAPCVSPLSNGGAMVELLANIYGNRLFHDELRIRELDIVHTLVSSVPVKVAATGADPALIGRFCEVLVNDALSR